MTSRRAIAWGLTTLLGAVGLVGCTHGKSPAASPRASHVARTPTPWQSPAGTSARPEPIKYALVAADGRKITVTAVGGGCTQARHLGASESSDTVALRLVVYDATGACASVLRVYTESTVLTAPLAGRRLTDALNGRAVQYFDGKKLAVVSWLPTGASAPEDRQDGPAWIRIYRFPARPKTATIQVEQAPGNIIGRNALGRAGGRVVTATQVRGRRATLFLDRDETGAVVVARLAWLEAGYTFVVSSVPVLAPERAFSLAVLERVAAGLRL